MRALIDFFRANPQALILLIVCLVLGLGMFVAVLISLAGQSNGTLSGEPSGAIALGRLLAP